MSSTCTAIKDHCEIILGFGSSVGEPGTCPHGSVKPFGSNIDPKPQRSREAVECVLRAAPALLESEITDVLQDPISVAARQGIAEVTADLEKRQIISRMHSPYKRPTCVGHKPHSGGNDPHLWGATPTPLSQPCAEDTITPLRTAINFSQDSTHPTGIPDPALNPTVTWARSEGGQVVWGEVRRHEGTCGDTGLMCGVIKSQK